MLAPYNPTAGAGGTPLSYGQTSDEDQLAKLKQSLGGALGAPPAAPTGPAAMPQARPPVAMESSGQQPPTKAPGAVAPPTPPPTAPAPTFAQLQSQGVARPAPPPAPNGGAYTTVNPQMMNEKAPGAGPLLDTANPLKPTDDPTGTNPTGGDAGGTTGGGGDGTTNTPTPTPTPTGTNPAFDPSQIPLYSQMSDALKQWLANPSRYTSQTAQDTYKSLGGLLDQDYAAQGKTLNDQLASRGISDSSIAGQKYSDLSTEQARAKANLAQSIETQQAETNGQDMSSALSSALGLGGLGVQQQALQQGGIMQTLALLSQYGLLSPDFLAKLGVKPAGG